MNTSRFTDAHKMQQSVFSEADRLKSHAQYLIKNKHQAPEWMWENLANAANDLDAAMQALELSRQTQHED